MQTGVEIVSASSGNSNTVASAPFAGCDAAKDWDTCLNDLPFKTQCNWGGSPKACFQKPVTATVPTQSVASSSQCPISLLGENDRCYFFNEQTGILNDYTTCCGAGLKCKPSPTGSVSAGASYFKMCLRAESATQSSTSCESAKNFGWPSWNFQPEYGVCGGSTSSVGECQGMHSHSVAADRCHSMGARLCTASELQSDVVAGTSCGYNNRYAWSSTPCTSGSSTGYIIRVGRHDPVFEPLCVSPTKISASTYEVYTRCCADYAGNGNGGGSAVITPASPAPYVPPTTKTSAVQAQQQTQQDGMACKDLNSQCREYVTLGFCKKSAAVWQDYMQKNCRQSCSYCSPYDQPPPIAMVTAAPSPQGICKIGIKKLCDGKATGCCLEGSECVLKGKKSKCRVLGLPSKKYPDGHVCEKPAQCESKFCDRKAITGHGKFECWPKPVRNKNKNKNKNKIAETSAASVAEWNPSMAKQTQEEEEDDWPAVMGVAMALIGILIVLIVAIIHQRKNRYEFLGYSEPARSAGDGFTESSASSYVYDQNPLAITDSGSQAMGDNTFDKMSDLVVGNDDVATADNANITDARGEARGASRLEARRSTTRCDAPDTVAIDVPAGLAPITAVSTAESETAEQVTQPCVITPV